MDPWGRTVLTHVAWNIAWVSVFVFITFLVAHASYIILSAHRVRPKEETDALEEKHPNLPKRVKRHTFMARLFHWVMAVTMLVLLFTGFLPVIGVQFAWVTIHWVAGVVLTLSIIFHIIHSTFWMDLWTMWISGRDITEAINSINAVSGRLLRHRESMRSTHWKIDCTTTLSLLLAVWLSVLEY